MKVFISHPMHGLSESEVTAIRQNALDLIKEENPDEFIEPINNYVYDDAPPNASRLWYLGRSIQCMANADYIYFCKNWQAAKGCLIEYFIAMIYELPVLNTKCPKIDK